jgi:hypothetical protein
MKLPIDMNLSPRWIKVLGNAGVEGTGWAGLICPRVDSSAVRARCAFARATRAFPFNGNGKVL